MRWLRFPPLVFSLLLLWACAIVSTPAEAPSASLPSTQAPAEDAKFVCLLCTRTIIGRQEICCDIPMKRIVYECPYCLRRSNRIEPCHDFPMVKKYE